MKRWFSLPTLAFLLVSSAFAQSSEQRERVRVLYEQGTKHYNLGEYDQAIGAFREAYRLSNVPSLLFNIAQAYRLKGPSGCEQALQFYRAYLREKVADPDRGRIERWIAEMQRCTEERKRETAKSSPAISSIPPERREVPPTRKPWYQSYWLWGGAAAVVAGGVLTAVLLTSRGASEASPDDPFDTPLR